MQMGRNRASLGCRVRAGVGRRGDPGGDPSVLLVVLSRVAQRDQGGRRIFVAVGGMLWNAVSPWIHVFVLKKKNVYPGLASHS